MSQVENRGRRNPIILVMAIIMLLAASAILPACTGSSTETPDSAGKAGSTTGTASITIALASTTTPSTFGKSVAFTATVRATSGTPTGTVTFKDGTTTLGTVTLSAGQAAFSTSTLSIGTHSITAVYGGDAHFASGASTALTQTVSQGAPSSPNLAGRWRAEEGFVPRPTYGTGALFFSQVEFLGDGTFILLDWMNASGTYSFPDISHIKLETTAGALVYGFVMSGDTFTLTAGDGNPVTFERIAQSDGGGTAPIDPDLTGRWQAEEGFVPVRQGYGTGALFFSQVEFLGDHTFILLDWMNASGTYSFPDGSHIRLQTTAGTLVYGFAMSGDTFTLTAGDGNPVTFQRVAQSDGGGTAPIDPDLTGRWQAEEGFVPRQGYGTGELFFSQVEFLGDRTFILLDWMNASGTYSFPDGSHIKLQTTGGTVVYGFAMSGDTFALMAGDGNPVTFQRS